MQAFLDELSGVFCQFVGAAIHLDIAHLATEPGMALTESPQTAQEPKQERAAEKQLLDYAASNADHDVT